MQTSSTPGPGFRSVQELITFYRGNPMVTTYDVQLTTWSGDRGLAADRWRNPVDGSEFFDAESAPSPASAVVFRSVGSTSTDMAGYVVPFRSGRSVSTDTAGYAVPFRSGRSVSTDMAGYEVPIPGAGGLYQKAELDNEDMNYEEINRTQGKAKIETKA